MEQLELPLDCTNADNALVSSMANEAVTCGDYLNWDHAYECLWDLFEQEIVSL